MQIMVKDPAVPAAKVSGDPKSGRSATVLGAGALKGRLKVREGVDLTRPIASQVLKGSKRRDEGAATKR